MAYYSKTKKIICENSYGYKLEFPYSFPYYLDSYSGIHEYSGNVATIKGAFSAGVYYVGTSVNHRQINLVIAFRDDETYVNKKQQLYNIFPLKDQGTLYYYEADIARKINYYVENVDISTRKGNHVYAVVNLICPSPYFMDSTETIAELHNWDKLFEFPMEIIDGTGIEFGSKNESTAIEISNESHIDYGLTITFTANGNVVNPILNNAHTGETLKVNYSMSTGDVIVITTYNDNKNIIYIDSQGNQTNINNALAFGTKFLQASNGYNKFVSDADSGANNLDLKIAYYNYYEAV